MPAMIKRTSGYVTQPKLDQLRTAYKHRWEEREWPYEDDFLAELWRDSNLWKSGTGVATRRLEHTLRHLPDEQKYH